MISGVWKSSMLPWLVAACLSAPFADAGLVSITGIRALSPNEAAEGVPLKVTGVVTFSNPGASTLFIHDGSAGMYVEQRVSPSALWPDVGDKVEVSGITGDGEFAPIIRSREDGGAAIRVLGKGSLPSPRKVDGEELANPSLDCDWVEVIADVSEVMVNDGDLILECRAGFCDFHALIEGPLPPESIPWELAESRVRIRGVAATMFNSKRQMTRRFLRVNALSDIAALETRGRSGEARLVGSSHLLRVDGPPPSERVRVQGVVTFNMPGQGMFVRTDGGGLWVQAVTVQDTVPGTVVEAEGWPRAGAMRPILRAVSVRVLDSQSPPEPLRHPAQRLLDARFDSELVSTKAELLNIYRGADGATLELRDGSIVFRSWLDPANGSPPDLPPGSKLLVSGIARITSAGTFNPLREEDKLLMLLRSPADIVLLEPPPWWTPQRVAWGFTALLVLLAAIYQRARLRRKRKLDAQRQAFEAVLAERGRFARDIHDSLAQGLTSVSLQLECVRNHLDESPAEASEHLETARSLVRDSMREARRTIWNLRPPALGETNLASALQKYADELTRGTAVSSRQQIEGTPRPLPQEHENALLRIGQESLTNAVKHAAPNRIGVRLRYGPRWVTLVVTDDGRGFDVASRMGKGYGLTGMRERVDTLGGSLFIDSRSGEGSEVSVTFPI